MSGRPKLWDRIAGALAPVPQTAVLLGRYQIPAGGQAHVVNGVTMPAGAYLAAGAGRWNLRRGAERWSGSFGTASMPAPIVMESVAVIARKVTDLRDAQAPLGDWIGIPPLVNGVTERLGRHPLENHLRAALRSLQKVSREPHARLRTEHVLLPVSKARRITWRTVVHLAAHSETWAARRMHGVEPAQLLTPVQIPDYDLYENRVVATLIDRLWRYVLGRIAEIDKIDSMVRQGRDLIEQAEKRPDWREKQRLYAFISEMLMADDLPAHIAQRREDLVALRNALAPLLTSPLRAGVRGPYTGPPRLRPTNLFDNEANYRRCRLLWDVEVASRQGSDDAVEPVEAMTAWCRDFAQYALVLVLRALEQLGLVPTASEAPRIGGPGPVYTYRGHVVRLDWNPDDTFTLSLRDEPVLRIVPLPHSLTAHTELTELDRHLNGLRSTAGVRAAVLYPGDKSEREALPLDRRLAVHTSVGEPGSPAMVPVSSTDLGSTSRVARALRYALDERIMLDYPVPVAARVAGAEMLARRFGWLSWRAGRLLVTRPPSANDLQRLGSALAELRTRTDAARRQGDNQTALNDLHMDLLAAAEQVRSLAWCPVCLRQPPDPAAVFTPRDNDTYRCHCPTCPKPTIWELRRCLSCQENYPVITIHTVLDQPGGHGDLIDEKFSQELLAVPCWQNPRSYLCHSCGHCPESSRATCARCHLRNGE